MGQRSQIYIKIKTEGKTHLIAKYYQWNYGERMISRARYGIEYIKKMRNYLDYYIEQIAKIIDVNFDMFDIALSRNILDEFKESQNDIKDFNDYVFKWQDNNDGKLFILVDENTIKYCFTDYDLKKFNSAKDYMDWDYENWENSEYLSEKDKKICKKNMEYISKNAELMTDNELKEFINDVYILPGINAPLF